MSKQLFKSAFIISSMTFISRILGFIRDLTAAHLFGATAAVDAFYVAFKIPNFMRNLFAEGSFSQAFTPVLSDYRVNHTIKDVRLFISYMLGAFIVVLSIVTLTGNLGAFYLVKIFAPGLDAARFNEASYMLRITFPYLILISLTAFAGSILNTYGKFASPALAPALLNICLIFFALIASRFFYEPVESQAWGVLVGGFIQFIFLLPTLYRIGLLVVPKMNWQDPGVKRVLKLMIPAIFGASIGQINLLINSIFASFLAVGSVTWLYYAERLAYFPLGVLGVSLATVLLSNLSLDYAKKSAKNFSVNLDWGIRCNLIVGIPASLIMMILSGPLIVTLFYYGKLTYHDVQMIQSCVISYAFGLQAFMLVKIFSSAFYACEDIRTPVKIAFLAVLVNIILSGIFMGSLKHSGLALASSIASWVSVIFLGIILYKRGVYCFQAGWFKFLRQMFLANSMLAIFLWEFSGDIMQWVEWSWYQRFFHIVYLGVGSVIMYVIGLMILGIRIRDFKIDVSSDCVG